MKILKTRFEGLLIFKQKNNLDKKKSLRETFNKQKFKQNIQQE